MLLGGVASVYEFDQFYAVDGVEKWAFFAGFSLPRSRLLLFFGSHRRDE